MGIVSTCWRGCAIFNKEFLVVSPTSKVTVVDDGGLASMDIISSAACYKKLSALIAGKGTTTGMQVIMSISLTALVWGGNIVHTYNV